MIFYTGIGSRSTPPDVLAEMMNIARRRAKAGLCLRSGGADGADAAFEAGAGDLKEIWLPWIRFNGNGSLLIGDDAAAHAIAKEVLGDFHWSRCNLAAKKLHARNCHQVLGIDLKTPSEEVVCWTPRGAVVGGTATALKIAAAWGIPILNLGGRT